MCLINKSCCFLCKGTKIPQKQNHNRAPSDFSTSNNEHLCIFTFATMGAVFIYNINCIFRALGQIACSEIQRKQINLRLDAFVPIRKMQRKCPLMMYVVDMSWRKRAQHFRFVFIIFRCQCQWNVVSNSFGQCCALLCCRHQHLIKIDSKNGSMLNSRLYYLCRKSTIEK